MASPSQSRLSRAYTQVPITAFAFYKSESGARYILAGEDTNLNIYREETRSVVGHVRVFGAQPIHGICVGSQQQGKVVVWGATEVAILDGALIENILGGEENGGVADDDKSGIKTGKAPDWIYDAAVSPYDPDSVVLATAHNEIVQVKVSDESLSFGDVISPSRPILYSANLTWTSPRCVLVAGGTVFGEILIWKCHLDRRGDQRHETLSVLTGHEGSIFGVHISEEMKWQDGRVTRLLASCSDDRTVRVWDITEGKSIATREEHQHDAVRETGFGSTPGQEPTRKESDEPVAMIMGHASRIWGVKIAAPPTRTISIEEPITILSFGEDSTTQKWHLSLDDQKDGQILSGQMSHQQTFSLHDGKHLWSHALESREETAYIVTGGADSKISYVEEPLAVAPSLDEATHNLVTFSLQDIIPSLPQLPIQSKGREVFSRYGCISDDHILATTTHGRLLLGTIRPEPAWRQIQVEGNVMEDLKQCYVLKKAGRGVALLGTSTGNLYRFSEGTGLLPIAKASGKIVDILLLSDIDSEAEGSLDLLVNIYGTSGLDYFSLNRSTGAIEAQRLVTGIDSRFVTVSAARIGGGLLVFGSRHGYISVLREDGDLYRPVLDLGSRSRDAITAIVPLPSSTGNPSAPPYLLVTTRDGKYRIYEIDQGEHVQVHLRHETSPPFGPMIEGAWFTKSLVPELILYGFKSQSFVVWNETRRQEIATVACGGAHRTFTLAHNPHDAHKVQFAFTKASKLSIFTKNRTTHQTIKPGTHGREIRAMSYNGRYLATGAEDTTIRIWKYQEQGEDTQLTCLSTTKAHVTGLQQLKWFGDGYLFSSGGNEEFFLWRIRRLESDYNGLAVVREAVFDDKSRDGDLRIMDFDVCRATADDSILLSMVFSNSALKTYRWTLDGGFQLLARTSYTGACLTQVRHLKVHDNGVSVLTASTDGHVATWEATFEVAEVASHRMVQALPVHQSSIKSLKIQSRDEGYLVLTGGDDNGLAVTSIAPFAQDAGTRGYTVSTRAIVRNAHAAAINGVVLSRQGPTTLAVSVSNDQRVKFWRVQEGSARMDLIADEYSGVADPGDIEMLGEDGNKVVLGGVGVEVWSLSG